ncbi:MAG: AAA family ATPase [Rhizobiales bacterium]|nr:AAA family ATPase [Hyphomicrobiales bacterium]
MNRDVTSQDTVFDLLANPATHGGAKVSRIDTHAASVFLAGDKAYKVKRAVRFPFLDYSSLEKRKAACEAELEVNRPFAPDIYRRVVPIIRQADSRLAIDGHGEPVEWAVEMRRFDENLTLDHLADAGKIDLALADALGRAVAAAHDVAPVIAAEPWIAALASYLDQNEIAFTEMPDLFLRAEAEPLIRASRQELERLRPRLCERGAHGLIRRVHGDLHLGNIVLLDGRPVLFDAIEFNRLIASGDVLYDLGFLLMDLAERGLMMPANIVLNRYLVETRRMEDLDALTTLPLFMSLRAAIRAKVTAARLEHTDASSRDGIQRAARTYFRLAQELIAPPRATLIAVGGLSGTGKSVLARALASDVAPVPGAVVLRSDVERKILFGRAETEKLPTDAYAPAITEKIYLALVEKARRIVAAGHSAVVDAVFAQPVERAAIAKIAQAAGVRFHGLFLTADLTTRITRVGVREKDASDADAAIARQQEKYELGTMDWARVDASGTPETTLAHAKAALH